MPITMFLLFHGVFGLIGLLLYFLPLGIAVSKRHPSVVGIGLVNVLLGWSVIGWVVALIWALSVPRRYLPPAPPSYPGAGYAQPRYSAPGYPPAPSGAGACPSCGRPLAPGQNFCTSCGARV